jgi:hypothetical protein
MPHPLLGRTALLVAGTLIASACASAPKQQAAPTRAANDAGSQDPTAINLCDNCQVVSTATKIGLPATSELSGIAASAVHEGVFYVHNDSGDTARFFAIDETGALKGTFKVKGATAQDWEDIAVGPCSAEHETGESCIFLADIGDNSEQRPDYTLYRVHEPASLGGTVEVDADALPFSYPDGSHNAEALLVHPQTGRIVIVTKANKGPSGVYSFPPSADWPPGKSVQPARVGDVSFAGGSPLATGGDVHPQGRGVLLRTYTHAWYYAGPLPGVGGDGTQTIEQMLTSTACAVPTAIEGQGEAIGWLRSGQGYVTVSEGAPLLHTVRCGG